MIGLEIDDIEYGQRPRQNDPEGVGFRFQAFGKSAQNDVSANQIIWFIFGLGDNRYSTLKSHYLIMNWTIRWIPC